METIGEAIGKKSVPEVGQKINTAKAGVYILAAEAGLLPAVPLIKEKFFRN